MRLTSSKYLAVLAVAAALPLGACASVDRRQPIAQSQADDDAYCQSAAGPIGSSAYTACRKDRDVAATRTDSKAERQHRNLAERMLNGQ